MSDVLKDSWNNFSQEFSKNYLKYFPKILHKEAVSHMFSTKENPSIIDIGCGNCQVYSVIDDFKKPFKYTGIDWSKPLLNVADNIANANIICDDILNEAAYSDSKFDFALVSHIIETVSSPEKLLNILSKKADYIYVIWFEYPRFSESFFEVRNYVNSYNESKNIISPYLRNKLSKDYWNFILQKNKLKVLKESYMSEKDVLTVLETEKK